MSDAAVALNGQLQGIMAKHNITAENYETVYDGVLKDVLRNVFKLDARIRGQACVVPAANSHTRSYRGIWSTKPEENNVEHNFEQSATSDPRGLFPKWAEPT